MSELAESTKTITALLDGFDPSDLARLLEHRPELKSLGEVTSRRNQVNFAWTARVVRLLNRKAIPVLVIKGPLRAKQVFGHWGVRPSLDVDLLVHRSDYDTAGRTLEDGGFRMLVSPDSQWWHDILGEAPHRHESNEGPFIDLHHQIQQPGGPYPRNLSAFFEDADEHAAGGVGLRVPSLSHALLITVIGYGKSVRAGEAWLHYAHEIATAWYNMDSVAREAAREQARRQGLVRIFDEALDVAKTLFLTARDETTAPLQDALTQSALGGQSHRPLFRSRRLWHWLDGNPVQKALQFPRHIGRVIRADAVRTREERMDTLENRSRIQN